MTPKRIRVSCAISKKQLTDVLEKKLRARRTGVTELTLHDVRDTEGREYGDIIVTPRFNEDPQPLRKGRVIGLSFYCRDYNLKGTDGTNLQRYVRGFVDSDQVLRIIEEMTDDKGFHENLAISREFLERLPTNISLDDSLMIVRARMRRDACIHLNQETAVSQSRIMEERVEELASALAMYLAKPMIVGIISPKLTYDK